MCAEDGFLPLDNRSNERPDWYEYWPIRRFLLSEDLDEDGFYGFLSPRFREKTNLSFASVRDFVRVQPVGTEAILFSPGLKASAYFLNVFQFGESVHPGLLEASNLFFRRLGHWEGLDNLITTSRNEVFSNYIVAKPVFWRAWLQLTEQLFAIAESKDDPLGEKLRVATPYRGKEAPLKVFILERLATWLLATRPFRVVALDPFVAHSRSYKLPGAVLCDALKIAYTETEHRQVYLQLFELISEARKALGRTLRLLAFLGVGPVTRCVDGLKHSWSERSSGRSIGSLPGPRTRTFP
jgi:hypothetical protein